MGDPHVFPFRHLVERVHGEFLENAVGFRAVVGRDRKGLDQVRVGVAIAETRYQAFASHGSDSQGLGRTPSRCNWYVAEFRTSSWGSFSRISLNSDIDSAWRKLPR